MSVQVNSLPQMGAKTGEHARGLKTAGAFDDWNRILGIENDWIGPVKTTNQVLMLSQKSISLSKEHPLSAIKRFASRSTSPPDPGVYETHNFSMMREWLLELAIQKLMAEHNLAAKVLTAGVQRGQIYNPLGAWIEMDRLGETLQEVLLRVAAALPCSTFEECRDAGNYVGRLLQPVMEKVKQMHELGIRHVDLYPRNVMCTQEFDLQLGKEDKAKWRIIDFGRSLFDPDKTFLLAEEIGDLFLKPGTDSSETDFLYNLTQVYYEAQVWKRGDPTSAVESEQEDKVSPPRRYVQRKVAMEWENVTEQKLIDAMTQKPSLTEAELVAGGLLISPFKYIAVNLAYFFEQPDWWDTKQPGGGHTASQDLWQLAEGTMIEIYNSPQFQAVRSVANRRIYIERIRAVFAKFIVLHSALYHQVGDQWNDALPNIDAWLSRNAPSAVLAVPPAGSRFEPVLLPPQAAAPAVPVLQGAVPMDETNATAVTLASVMEAINAAPQLMEEIDFVAHEEMPESPSVAAGRATRALMGLHTQTQLSGQTVGMEAGERRDDCDIILNIRRKWVGPKPGPNVIASVKLLDQASSNLDDHPLTVIKTFTSEEGSNITGTTEAVETIHRAIFEESMSWCTELAISFTAGEHEFGPRIHTSGIMSRPTDGSLEAWIEIVRLDETLDKYLKDVMHTLADDMPDDYYTRFGQTLGALLVSVLDKVNVMHFTGIIHRDLRTRNVMYAYSETEAGPEYTWYVIDFGLARTNFMYHDTLLEILLNAFKNAAGKMPYVAAKWKETKLIKQMNIDRNGPLTEERVQKIRTNAFWDLYEDWKGKYPTFVRYLRKNGALETQYLELGGFLDNLMVLYGIDFVYTLDFPPSLELIKDTLQWELPQTKHTPARDVNQLLSDFIGEVESGEHNTKDVGLQALVGDAAMRRRTLVIRAIYASADTFLRQHDRMYRDASNPALDARTLLRQRCMKYLAPDPSAQPAQTPMEYTASVEEARLRRTRSRSRELRNEEPASRPSRKR